MVAVAAVDSPPLLEMEEGRGAIEEEEEEGMGRRRLGEKEKGTEEKGVQEEAQTEIHQPAFHSQALLPLPACSPLSLSDLLPLFQFCLLLPTHVLPPHIHSVCLPSAVFLHASPAQVLPVHHPHLEHVPPPVGWAVSVNPVPVMRASPFLVHCVHAGQIQVVEVAGVY